MQPNPAIESQYRQLVLDHSLELFRYAYRLCGNRHTAEDLVQETYYQAWRHLHQLRDATKARAWLFQIVRRGHTRWLKTARGRPTQSLTDHDPAAAADQGVEQRDALQIALNQLDNKFKEPLLLVAVQGLTCDEAARELGVPLGTVLSRLYRARQALKAHYPESAGGTRASNRTADAGPGDINKIKEFPKAGV